MKLICALVLCIQICFPQTQLWASDGDPVLTETLSNISGQVVDAQTGESLTGVRVKVKGSDQYVISNEDGYFELSYFPSEGEILELSFVSFETLEVEVQDAKALFQIALSER